MASTKPFEDADRAPDATESLSSISVLVSASFTLAGANARLVASPATTCRASGAPNSSGACNPSTGIENGTTCSAKKPSGRSMRKSSSIGNARSKTSAERLSLNAGPRVVTGKETPFSAFKSNESAPASTPIEPTGTIETLVTNSPSRLNVRSPSTVPSAMRASPSSGALNVKRSSMPPSCMSPSTVAVNETSLGTNSNSCLIAKPAFTNGDTITARKVRLKMSSVNGSD